MYNYRILNLEDSLVCNIPVSNPLPSLWPLVEFSSKSMTCSSFIDLLKTLPNESILLVVIDLLISSHFVSLFFAQVIKLTMKGRFCLSFDKLEFNRVLHYINIFVAAVLGIFNVNNFMGGNKFECEDLFGIRTSTIQWLDWLFTVPYMLFVLKMIYVKKGTDVNVSFLQSQFAPFLSYLSMISLFLTSFVSISLSVKYLLFISSHIFMITSLSTCIYEIYEEYYNSKKAFIEFYNRYEEIVSKDPNNNQLATSFDRLKRAQFKINCALYIIVTFVIIASTYFICLFGLINNDSYKMLIRIENFFVKGVFMSLVYDYYAEMLDPVSFHIVADNFKANYDEGRLAFLRYVFHEVRVPLNSLTLGIDLLMESDQIIDEDKSTIKLMKDSAVFMAETLNDVLSLQKIEEGKMILEYKPFHISELVNNVLSIYRNHYQSRSITIYSLIDTNVPNTVIGDRFRLEHVLGNFLSNAIKFSNEGGSIDINISYNTLMPDHITFSVKDKGVGISEEDQNLLFQSFVQIRPGDLQQGKGSGLGLTICKNLVKLHGGSIGMTSKARVGNDLLSGGSDFFFHVKFEIGEDIGSLHLTQDPSSLLIDSIASPIMAVTDVHEVIKNILICDDATSNSKMLSLVLKQKTLESDVVINGLDVNKCLSMGMDHYSLIFMDNMMPVMNGLQATKKLRALGFKNLIIGLTGNSLDVDVYDFENAGADVVLPKPLRASVLVDLIDFCIVNGVKSSKALKDALHK